METLPDFIKLYGRISGTLKPGVSYELEVENNFDGLTLGTNKYVYFSEVGMLGGRNFVLAYIFFGAAVILLCTHILFFICYFAKLHKRNRDNETFLRTLRY